MFDTYAMRNALDALDSAVSRAVLAEDERTYAWSRYLATRAAAVEAQDERHAAERKVMSEASRLANQPARPNRDERRAQVVAGLDGLPF